MSAGSGTGVPHALFRRRAHPLDVFFAPGSVALVGASEQEGSVGRTLLWNLISSPFGGTVYPVNPHRSHVLGIRTYPSVSALPEPVDLAVIATPAPTVPAIVAECARAGVQGAIVISAGFQEAGVEGVALAEQIRHHVRQSRMRLIGPNCLGVMRPLTGLNATFAGGMALPGNVAFISQSGALLTGILDWSLRELVGFSAFLSIGSMLDVGWGDLIDYFGSDPHTRAIVLYMETIGDARAFLSAAREVALSKPIIVLKPGRTDQAARAAASHTGALTGSDAAIDAAFRRCGVVRVSTVAELFHISETLARQPRPPGPRLTILTNAGGPGVLAADTLLLEGGQLAELSEETLRRLDGLLPAHWSHGNPVDILGDADPERYARAVEIVAQDPNADGLLVILTPQAMTDPTRTAEQLRPFAHLPGKPVLAAWMGGSQVAAGQDILNRAGIPSFAYPDSAVRTFLHMWRYTYNLRGIYETPVLPASTEEHVRAHREAQEILDGVIAAGRTLLTEVEAKRLLQAYGISAVPTFVASSEEEAVRIADDLGYPVVLKVHSESVTHKTDAGGVHLDLHDAAAVRAAYHAIEHAVRERMGAEAMQGVTVQPMVRRHGAYEVILGGSTDPQLGPLVLFGTGGQLVEVFHDVAVGLPPLTTTLARRMMEQTRIYRALQGVRGRPAVDLVALEQLIVRFGDLIVTHRRIAEMDINPLLVSPEGFIALDARVRLHAPGILEADLPRPAIRPYPSQYVSAHTLPDGTPIIIRPIRPEDEPLVVRFHATLSEETVYFRYFHLIHLHQRTAHERLLRICFNDYDREIALVAEAHLPDPQILAIARLSRRRMQQSVAEFALLVTDRFQGQGLGTELLRRLIEVARAERVECLVADILPDNYGMLRLAEKMGFTLTRRDDVVHAEMRLTG
ncbi:MAG: bifunctional acetate--CoA ligase family protein/GNAT family N-acetyltransferase [Chloroherpetonaceae bacterium]|nr:bifunctional acetate--CoA ligase family protein/GNAT family N-acetyltransferase [Chloroherpetonaceae bacterium]